MANVEEPGTPQPQPQYQTAPPPKDNTTRNCLLGCLFLIGVGVALTICAGVGTYWWVSSKVEQYTSAQPRQLPTVDYSAEELQALKDRIETFSEAVEQDETAEEELVLTAEEINALLNENETLRGRIFVRIEDGQVSGDVSIPTDRIPGGRDRFFNGSASFDVSMQDGMLDVRPTSMEFNDEPLPEDVVEAMARQNWARDSYNDPETAKTLRKFEDIRVEEETIVLKLKRDTPAEETDPAQGTDEAEVTEEAPPTDDTVIEAEE